MYIEFVLSQVQADTVGYLVRRIAAELQEWSDKYDIPYIKKHHKLSIRVTFDQNKTYSFFALTWSPSCSLDHESDRWLTNYRLIEPMNML